MRDELSARAHPVGVRRLGEPVGDCAAMVERHELSDLNNEHVACMTVPATACAAGALRKGVRMPAFPGDLVKEGRAGGLAVAVHVVEREIAGLRDGWTTARRARLTTLRGGSPISRGAPAVPP